MHSVYFIIVKYLITAGIIVLVSELVKVSGKFGAFIAALPTVTILVMVWMYIEGQPQEKIANHAWYTLWYVIPTLPMFIAFPFLYKVMGFWQALLASSLLMALCLGLLMLVMRRFDIKLY